MGRFLFELFVFVSSTGIFFKQLTGNRFAVFLAGLVAITSTYFMVEELVIRKDTISKEASYAIDWIASVLARSKAEQTGREPAAAVAAKQQQSGYTSAPRDTAREVEHRPQLADECAAKGGKLASSPNTPTALTCVIPAPGMAVECAAKGGTWNYGQDECVIAAKTEAVKPSNNSSTVPEINFKNNDVPTFLYKGNPIVVSKEIDHVQGKGYIVYPNPDFFLDHLSSTSYVNEGSAQLLLCRKIRGDCPGWLMDYLYSSLTNVKFDLRLCNQDPSGRTRDCSPWMQSYLARRVRELEHR